MSEEEKYDELIRQKFAEQEFMFNEANWEKAEAMIDASRKTKRIFWWSSVFLIGIITGIFLMLPLINNTSSSITTKKEKLNGRMVTDNQSKKSSSDKTKGESAAGTTPVVDDQSLFSSEPKEINAETNNNENSSRTTIDELNGYNAEALSAQKKSASSVSTDQFQKNKFSKDFVRETGSKNAQQTSESKTVLKAKQNKNAEVDADPSQNIQETSGLSTPQKKKKANKFAESDKNVFAIAHEKNVIKNAISHTPKKNDRTSETKEEAITDGKQSEEAENGELAEKETSTTDPADSTRSENKLAAENAAKIDALNDSTKQEEKKLVAADSAQKSDSVKLAPQEKAVTPALDGLASATFLSVDAGINGQLGWKNQEVIEGRGITPVLGLGITHAFNQTWSFSSGIQYNGIWYLKGDKKTAKATTYDFGSTTIITTTKPRLLHYVAVPLTIQYHFNDKNAILAGGSFSYLLNAKSKVEESTTRVGPAATSTISADNSSNSDYNKKTFNPFDAAFGIGYRRKISAHFSITGTANFGLLDIKQNSFFMKNTFERNSGLKVILSYTIFDF
jgi:hypothetical protein